MKYGAWLMVRSRAGREHVDGKNGGGWYGNRVWGLEVGWELSMTVWVWERRKLGGS